MKSLVAILAFALLGAVNASADTLDCARIPANASDDQFSACLKQLGQEQVNAYNNGFAEGYAEGKAAAGVRQSQRSVPQQPWYGYSYGGD